jgi:two-component system KDP operon response regulator KdpE
MNRVLVIGERPDEAKALAFRLGLSGYESAPSAGEATLALRAVFAFKPDAIVLDVSSGEESRELFKLLERVAQTPTLVIGEGPAGDDPVWYLEEGAVAYLQKPVSPTLLAARLATVLRRAAQSAPNGTITAGNIALDLARHQVQRNGEIVPLTPTEFRLLQVLAEHMGRPCSQRLLLEQVWGQDFVHCTHYLRLYMGYLRQKLEADPKNPRLLITEWGIGYRLVADQRDVPIAAAQPARAALT